MAHQYPFSPSSQTTHPDFITRREVLSERRPSQPPLHMELATRCSQKWLGGAPKNSLRGHQRSSLVVQRVKDLVCHCRGSDCCCGTGSIASPGTSAHHGHGQKKKKKRKEKEAHKELVRPSFVYSSSGIQKSIPSFALIQLFLYIPQAQGPPAKL